MYENFGCSKSQYFRLSDILTITFLICVKWYLIAVWLCIFSMTNDTEDFFTCFFAFPVSSLGSSVTWLSKCYAVLKILSLYCYCKRFLYVLHIPLPDLNVLNIFFRPFHILSRCFIWATVFSIHGTQFIFLFFLWLMYCVFYLRNKVFGEILQSFVL